MVAVAGQIADRHLGVGDRCLDHRFDIVGVHRHPVLSNPAFRIAAGGAAGDRQNLAWTPFYVTLRRIIFPIQSLQNRWIVAHDHNGLTEEADP